MLACFYTSACSVDLSARVFSFFCVVCDFSTAENFAQKIPLWCCTVVIIIIIIIIIIMINLSSPHCSTVMCMDFSTVLSVCRKCVQF